MWSCNFLLQKVCAGTSEKMVNKQQSNKTLKKSEVKNSSSKNIFLKTMHIFSRF